MKYGLLILIFLASALTSAQSFAFGPSICNNSVQLKSLWEKKYQSFVQNPISFEKSELLAKAFCFLEYAQVPKMDFLSYVREFASGGIYILWNDSDKGRMAKTDYGGHSIEILPPFFTLSDSHWDYQRASALIHEARHLEIRRKIDNHTAPPNSPNSHVVCTHGEAVNIDACEQTLSDTFAIAGALSYEVIFYKMLFDNSSNDVDRKEIAWWTVVLLNNYFNEIDPSLYKMFTKGFEKYIDSSNLIYR